MANHNKNIFIGVGGKDIIAKTHSLGAVYGTERLMGHFENPFKSLLNYVETTLASNLPLCYVMTVRGRDRNGGIVTRGLFGGNDQYTYVKASRLSQEVNINLLDKAYNTMIVYLDPNEFKSTWVGNKAVYRTRMAIADGGHLVIIAPGIKQFGEEEESDRIIRKYGYRSIDKVLELIENNYDLVNNLTAASHLIISSPEDRFKITYCIGGIERKQVQDANLNYRDINEATEEYSANELTDGVNTLPNGEEVFFVSKPAQGLWMARNYSRESN